MTFTKSYIKDYPRPSLVRKSFELLNGVWDFRFDTLNQGILDKWYLGFTKEHDIIVPYAYNSIASGINLDIRKDVVWYQKRFTKNSTKNHILHIEGSDDHTMIYVNGFYIGENKGAYHRISFDITHVLKDENLIVIRVQDDFNCDKPRGKQRWKNENFGCWYHETTGIWKTVWLEYVDKIYLKKIRFIPRLDERMLIVEYDVNQFQPNLLIELKIEFNQQVITTTSSLIMRASDSLVLSIKTDEDQFKISTWDVNQPNLYDVTIIIKDEHKTYDYVMSYFGVTKWITKEKGIYLNDNQIYLKMILDQGYWHDTGLTPPSEEALIKDVLLIKEMGFNGVRKHQKIEDERFYYFCDVFGLYVWLEMPSAYEYNQTMINRVTQEWMTIVGNHLNFASIMSYVIFNESWGVPAIMTHRNQQLLTVGLYHLTKSIDSSRFVISNDGWEHTLSDIITIHNYVSEGHKLSFIYEDIHKVMRNEFVKDSHTRLVFADGYSYQQQPIIISEYGGVAFETDHGWGYGDRVKTKDEFINRLKGLTKAIMDMKDVSGYCLTQLTDVEQEVNGLLNVYRIPKIELKDIKNINKK